MIKVLLCLKSDYNLCDELDEKKKLREATVDFFRREHITFMILLEHSVDETALLVTEQS